MFFYSLLSGWTLVLLPFVLYIIVVLQRASNDYQIKKLGSRAPILKSRVPLGLDFPYNALKSVRNHTVYEMWVGFFERAGCRAIGSDTFEFGFMIAGRCVFTTDPENIKAVLAAQFADYGKGPYFHAEWKAFLGDSIFTTDGKLWHDSRQMIRPMFMRERVADLDLVEVHVEKLLGLMGRGDGASLRFDKLLSRYTLDTATDFLFGQTAGSLEDEHSKFGLAFDDVQSIQALNVRAGLFSFMVSQKPFWNGLSVMEEFIDPWITAVLKLTPQELDAKLQKSDTFIHALARNTRDRKVIRDQLVSLLLAGRDSTAATLSWMFLELARNPKVVAKIHAEIAEVVGDAERPTYENVKDMKYLNWVINETLRLYPVVPYNVRFSLQDTTLPRGGGPNGTEPVGIRAGTPIGYSTLVMQRTRHLYPPVSEKFPYDPLEWVPERWATWTPKSWQYLPFNGGPRICIGQQFALVEMGYTTIRILQTFDRVIDHGNRGLLKTDILLTPVDGVKLGFVKDR